MNNPTEPPKTTQLYAVDQYMHGMRGNDYTGHYRGFEYVRVFDSYEKAEAFAKLHSDRVVVQYPYKGKM